MEGEDNILLTGRDLLNDTLNTVYEKSKDDPSKLGKKKKELTAEQHLKVQNNPLASDLILDLQKSAREETFIGAAPKKRGRPPSLKKSGDSAPPPQPKPKEGAPPPPNAQANTTLVRQICAYVKLYPHLAQYLPHPSELFGLETKKLKELYELCKKEANSCSSTDMEYDAVKNVFFAVLDKFENICWFLDNYFKLNLPILQFLAQFPPGTFSEYVRLCNETGEGVDKELREISIQFIGMLPDSVYMRLLLKLSYKVYDYRAYQQNSYLRTMDEKLAEQSTNDLPDNLNDRIKELKKVQKSRESPKKKTKF